MKNSLSHSTILLLAIVFTVVSQPVPEEVGTWTVSSPDKTIQVVLNLDQESGELFYEIERVTEGCTKLIEASSLGLIVDGDNYNTHLTFRSKTDITTITEDYTLTSGKQLHIEDTASQCDVTFTTMQGFQFTVRFRVFNTGVAFRYIIASRGKDKTCYIFSDETTFNLPQPGKFWGQPYDYISKWTPAYEACYSDGEAIGTRAPADKNGWAFPMLFQTTGGWALITEAAMYGENAAMHLEAACEDGVYKMRFPEEDEACNTCTRFPEVSLPWESPWRVILLSASLNDLFKSNLVTSLSRANVLGDVDWIKPGRASWSWWSASDSPRDFSAMLPFIDLASDLKWEYFLVDANWNHMQNGDLEKLAVYAAEKGVGLLVWYNSGGAHNTVTEEPRDQMDSPDARKKTFAWLKNIGVKGVKVDFFQSDKNCILKQYRDILEDAAAYGLMVNFHGCTIPRGWRRTYPNLVSMEAVRGAECYKFDKNFSVAAPKLNTIYPFTRNIIGPMDYTPVTFTHNTLPHYTSFAHELALSVVFESGILHFADAVEAYKSQPDFVLQFMKNVPVYWDETRLVEGFPGKDIVVARRSGNSWYVAGINGEYDQKTMRLPFDFPGEGSYKLNIIFDGETNKQYQYLEKQITCGHVEVIRMLHYGGFVAVITPVAD